MITQKLDVTGLQYDGNHTASLIGNLIAVDTGKGTITVKITGSQISVMSAKPKFRAKMIAITNIDYLTSKTR